MKRIAVAYGPNGHTTLAWGVELARLADVPLDVVSVFEPTYAEVSPDWLDELVTTRRDELARIVDEYTDVDIDVVVRTGPEPLREFGRHLDEHASDLGVVGAHDTHGVYGLGFGLPAHALLHHASQPIAVIRPDHEPLSGGIVVVGVDGSPSNAAALRWAADAAATIGGSTHAVHVEAPADATLPADEVESWVSGQLRAADPTTSVPSEFHRRRGHPTAELLAYATSVGAAMVVVGTRGQGGFDGLVLGRVPAQLLTHCAAPLVVVPH